ncbi:DNA repair protein rad52 [Dimargaris cristalligena]|nr:DNA repair protein rad52 [Dimargaris cristalligena]
MTQSKPPVAQDSKDYVPASPPQFSEAEKHGIQNALSHYLPNELLCTRAAFGGSRLTYVEGWRVISIANQIFGFNGWSSTIKDTNVDFAKKEAVTDGLKRALRMFGNALGNCLYDKEYLKQLGRFSVQKAQPYTEDKLFRPTNGGAYSAYTNPTPNSTTMPPPASAHPDPQPSNQPLVDPAMFDDFDPNDEMFDEMGISYDYIPNVEDGPRMVDYEIEGFHLATAHGQSPSSGQPGPLTRNQSMRVSPVSATQASRPMTANELLRSQSTPTALSRALPSSFNVSQENPAHSTGPHTTNKQFTSVPDEQTTSNRPAAGTSPRRLGPTSAGRRLSILATSGSMVKQPRP